MLFHSCYSALRAILVNVSLIVVFAILFSGTATAQPAVKKGFKPFMASTMVLGALSFLTPQVSSAQIEADTLWATGIISAKNTETGNPVGGVEVTMRPESVQMYTPDTTFNYVTEGGFAPFNVIAYIDSTVGEQENELERNIKTWVWDKHLNIKLPSNIHEGRVSIFAINGQKLGEYSVNGQASIPLEGLANAVYVYSINTPEGVVSNKFTRWGVGSSKDESRNFKSAQLYDATYWVKWEKEDYITDSMLVTVHDGENDPLFIQMEPEGGSGEVPQYQYIEGYIWDEDLSGLENTLVQIYQENGDVLLGSTNSSSSGHYAFDDPVPAGTEIYFKVEKDETYYAYDGDIALNNCDNYEVPSTIENYNDTINENFHFVMYHLSREVGNTGVYVEVSSLHIREMIGNCEDGNIEPALRDLKYYLGSTMTESMKQGYRSNTSVLESEIVWPDLFTESNVPLNQGSNYDPYDPQFDVGINVEQGANATNTNSTYAVTPLGHLMTPVFESDMTLVDATYREFVHEHGRALGFHGVGYYSIMKDNSPAFTDDDKVMFHLGLEHFDNVYDKGKAYFGLSSLVESLERER